MHALVVARHDRFDGLEYTDVPDPQEKSASMCRRLAWD